MVRFGDRALGLLGVAVLGGALAQAACSSSVFVCHGDDDCRSGGMSGTCEATGYCSFPDPSCASGARYGGLAGDSLADECVPPGEGSTGTDTSSGSSTAATTTATSVDATGPQDDSSSGSETTATSATTDAPTTGDASVCGNGDVEPGEDCDDENRIDGDGCNGDCTASGTLRWELVEDGPSGLADGAASIDIDADDRVYVGAWFTIDQSPQLAARSVSADGEIAWTSYVPSVVAWDSAYAWGLALDSAGDVVLAGDAELDRAPQWVVAHFDEDGEAGWLVVEPGEAFGAATGNSVWVAGRSAEGEARVVGYSNEGDPQYEHTGNPLDPSDDSIPWDVAIDDGNVLAVGELLTETSHAYAVLASPEGTLLSSLELASDWTQALALARSPDGWWIVGGSDVQGGGWLARISTGIDLVEGPAIVTELNASASLHGVAFGPAGEAVLVGWQAGIADQDALVQKYGPDGALAWTRTYDGGAGKPDYARDAVITSDGTIVIAGHVGALTDEGDFWLFAVSE